MYIKVKLIKGYAKPLTYEIPASWKLAPQVGDIVCVPIRNRESQAVVTELIHKTKLLSTFTIRQAVRLLPLPEDTSWKGFIHKVACYYLSDTLLFYQRIRSFIVSNHEPNISPVSSIKEYKASKNISLTPQQKKIVDFILPHIEYPRYTPTLIHGVTGSGKTEIYKKIIRAAIDHKKSVIFMVPEVSLALQFESIFKKTLASDIIIAGFHCATTPSQKKDVWQHLLAKDPIVIIGVHLPILLPIANLGAIIIDEEHEASFTEKKHPHLNSKEIAIWRASLYKIPIILGSATPSLTSLAAIKTKKWHFFTLHTRFCGEFPAIQQVPLLSKKKRSSFWITKELHTAISETLARKEQIILYLNRRGYCFFVICSECSYTFTCRSCSVSLTLHTSKKSSDEPTILMCHYCGYTRSLPSCCPSCKAGQSKLGKKGVGTQQLITIIKKLFPSARIARADLDTVKKKRSWQETVDLFSKGEIDILIGTQTITKGYHFPNVTLVGVIWADLHLHLPIYNAREQTLQKLIQVAGRAGRSDKKSTVIMQTMQDSDLMQFVDETKYLDFFNNEMAFRKIANYPPFCRLVKLELRHKDTSLLIKESKMMFSFLLDISTTKYTSIDILGPIKPAVHRIKNYDSRHIFLKAQEYTQVYALLRAINLSNYNSDILISPSA